MVEPVAVYLNGRGHPNIRARDAGLADAEDADVREYCAAQDPPPIVVTFDPDFKRSLVRKGIRCLFFTAPELTAPVRLRRNYSRVIALFRDGEQLVTIPRIGIPYGSTDRAASRSGRRARTGAGRL